MHSSLGAIDTCWYDVVTSHERFGLDRDRNFVVTKGGVICFAWETCHWSGRQQSLLADANYFIGVASKYCMKYESRSMYFQCE